MFFERRAMVGPQLKNGEPPAREVLLIPQILVANDEQFEGSSFRLAEEVPIGQITPPKLDRCKH